MEEETKKNDSDRVLWQDRKHHLWFPISFTKYIVKNNRLLIQKGFLNSQLDETLLYRIVDLTMNQSLLGKLFGTGNISITNRVDTEPVIILENIKNPLEVYGMLSEAVEESRKTQNVVGKEFYGSRGSGNIHDCCGENEFDFGGSSHEIDGDV